LKLILGSPELELMSVSGFKYIKKLHLPCHQDLHKSVYKANPEKGKTQIYLWVQLVYVRLEALTITVINSLYRQSAMQE
jgi:hypothetical protein